jgi:PEP-CTERM motif
MKSQAGSKFITTIRTFVICTGLFVTATQTPVFGKTKPFWNVQGTATAANTIRIDLRWTDSTGQRIDNPYNVKIPKDATAQNVAEGMAGLLNKDPAINTEWKWTAVNAGNGVWTVQGAPQPGMTPSALKEIGAKPKGDKGLTIGAGGDPTTGIASFNVFGPVSNTVDGIVSIGVEGLVVSTPTFDLSGAKNIATIKNDLLDGLQADGFTSAFLSPYTGQIVVPGVSTGDPIGTGGSDDGALFFTNDSSIGGYVAMQIGDIPDTPEPSSLLLLGSGLLGAGGFLRKRL